MDSKVIIIGDKLPVLVKVGMLVVVEDRWSKNVGWIKIIDKEYIALSNRSVNNFNNNLRFINFSNILNIRIIEY